MNAVNIRLARPDEAELLLQIHHASVQGLCAGQYDAEQIAHWFDGRDAGIYTQRLLRARNNFNKVSVSPPFSQGKVSVCVPTSLAKGPKYLM